MRVALKRFFILLLAIAVAAGIWTAYQRHQIEKMNRGVEIAVDSRLLWREDFGGGKPAAPQLQDLKEAGCTAVAVNPLTLAELEKTGQVSLLESAELQRLQALGLLARPGEEYKDLPRGLYIVTDKGDMYEKLRLGLAPLLGEAVATYGDSVRLSGPGKGFTLFIPEHYAPSVRELPIILPGEQMLSWSREGFTIIPLFNPPSRFPALLNEKYWEALSLQLQEILQGGNIAMGPVAFPAASFNYPSPQSTTGEIFRNERLSLGLVEFTQGNGLKELAAALDYRVLRTHLIAISELGQLGEKLAVERFLRAVQERGVRVLLLAPFPELDPRSEFDAYRRFINTLAGTLREAGFITGGGTPLAASVVPVTLQSLFTGGTAAAAVLLASFFLFKKKIPAGKAEKDAGTTGVSASASQDKSTLKVRRRMRRLEMKKERLFQGISITLVLAALALPLLNWGPFLSPALFRKGTALLASLVFPVLSTVFFLEPALQSSPGRGYLKEVVKGFLLASLLTTGGALIAAGLLGDTAYLLKIEYFQGVKISQVGPFILLGIFILLQKGQGLKNEAKKLLEQQIKIKHLLLLGVAGGALLVYIVRGGNFSILPVSQLELALRRYLEILLVARPRFKEFLIGHPVFFLMAALVPSGIKGAKTLALLAALLGQVSLFNTFMHLHRPVSLSLLGTAYGVGLGMLFGLVLYLAAAHFRAHPM
jgi:hypothetical protein